MSDLIQALSHIQLPLMNLLKGTPLSSALGSFEAAVPRQLLDSVHLSPEALESGADTNPLTAVLRGALQPQTPSGPTAGRSLPQGGAEGEPDIEIDPEMIKDMPERYKSNPMAQEIWQISKEEGADPRIMLSTAIVESGLRPRAVGDNGTSFGLYQYHQGGALGNHDAEWAFKPENITRDEARRFAKADVHDGAGAAAVQRPADPKGYAREVDNTARGLDGK